MQLDIIFYRKPSLKLFRIIFSVEMLLTDRTKNNNDLKMVCINVKFCCQQCRKMDIFFFVLSKSLFAQMDIEPTAKMCFIHISLTVLYEHVWLGKTFYSVFRIVRLVMRSCQSGLLSRQLYNI